jgi:uncharacterized protein
MTLAHIHVPNDQLADFCRRHHIRKLALFGSVLRDDFGPDSDIDVLVEFEDDVRLSFGKLMAMEDELTAIFGKKVDLGERRSVDEDKNYIRREHILRQLQSIYPAERG